MTPSSWVSIGVYPPSARVDHRRLFDALERVFPVRFTGLDFGQAQFHHGAILLSRDEPVLTAVEAAGMRTYLAAGEVGVQATSPIVTADGVTFGSAPEIDRYLRNQQLSDSQIIGTASLDPALLDIVLASVDGHPVWGRATRGRAAIDVVSMPPVELTEGEVLRDHLFTGRFMALAPLVHFLRELTADQAWDEPPIRACIVLDDPNFHAMSYGWLDYQQLVAKAKERNFHVAIATVPLDGWLTRNGPKRLVAEHPGQLSVAVHGNDHLRFELWEQREVSHYVAVLAKALRRMDRLRDQGLPYDRVQIAPHNRCGAPAAQAMLLLGYDALSITRTFRTRAGFDDPVATGGWNLADVTPGGLPVLVRMHLHDSRDDLRLRAFLRVPIILYGHHEDTANDQAQLIEAASDVNALGQVEWMSLARIARTNLLTRRQGSTLRVRPYSRRVELTIPDRIEHVRIELPLDHPVGLRDRVMVGENAAAERDLPLQPGENRLETALVAVDSGSTVTIRLSHPESVFHQAVVSPRSKPWSLTRRVLVEARDRGMVSLQRAGAIRG